MNHLRVSVPVAVKVAVPPHETLTGDVATGAAGGVIAIIFACVIESIPQALAATNFTEYVPAVKYACTGLVAVLVPLSPKLQV